MDQKRLEQSLENDGYVVVKDVYDDGQVREILAGIVAITEDESQQAVRSSRGTVFAARNLIDVVPNLQDLWWTKSLASLLHRLLGEDCGLVRAIYFDKPSHRSWSLPFHKDMTIAVEDNSLPTDNFSKPTRKAGVDHVEASEEVLQNMLTLRVHLDDVTVDNGPLQVMPGSHKTGKQVDSYDDPPELILVTAGDVLAMRPLVSHGSGHANPDLEMQRRILHLEFCGIRELPDGYRWQHFVPVST